MKPAARSRLWRELKPFVGPAIIVVIYAIVRIIYGAAAGGHGMLTPSGSLDSGRAALGLVTVGLRIFVLVVVTCAVVYRIVMRLLRRWTLGDAGIDRT